MMRRLVVEDGGQDLVEYALLAGFVSFASFAALTAIQSTMKTTYVSWGTKSEALSCMPRPGTGVCD